MSVTGNPSIIRLAYSDTACDYCGEVAEYNWEGSGDVCEPCVHSIAEHDRLHIPEAWCPSAGCYRLPVEEGQPCERYCPVTDPRTVFDTADCLALMRKP